MKYLSQFVLTFMLLGRANAASLTCVDNQTSPPTKWGISSDGVVSRGNLSIEEPISEIQATLGETGEDATSIEKRKKMVEVRGIEPLTPSLQS